MAKNKNTQRIFLICRWMTVCQKVPKSYVLSKSIFDIKKTFKNINLGDYFSVKTLFSSFNFEPLYFLKLSPIFDELTFLVWIFFLSSMLILDQKILLFSTSGCFEIPQPNWYYYLFLCLRNCTMQSFKKYIRLWRFLKLSPL